MSARRAVRTSIVCQKGHRTVFESILPSVLQRCIQNGKNQRRCESLSSWTMTSGHGKFIFRYSGVLPRPFAKWKSGGSASHASSLARSTWPSSGQSIQSEPGLIP